MSTKVILHGGFTRKKNDLNKSFFKEFLEDIKEQGTVLVVMFASRADSPQEHFESVRDMFSEHADGKVLNYEMADQEDFIKQLELSDGVYIQGGSTDKLLSILRLYDQTELRNSLKGKTIAGSSAGAYALAKYGASHHSSEVRPGLGIVPVRVVCHYKSSELPPHEEATKALEETHSDLDIIYLKDCEWEKFRVEL